MWSCQILLNLSLFCVYLMEEHEDSHARDACNMISSSTCADGISLFHWCTAMLMQRQGHSSCAILRPLRASLAAPVDADGQGPAALVIPSVAWWEPFTASIWCNRALGTSLMHTKMSKCIADWDHISILTDVHTWINNDHYLINMYSNMSFQSKSSIILLWFEMKNNIVCNQGCISLSCWICCILKGCIRDLLNSMAWLLRQSPIRLFWSAFLGVTDIAV